MVRRKKICWLRTEWNCGCLFPGLFLIFISDSVTREIHQTVIFLFFLNIQVETTSFSVAYWWLTSVYSPQRSGCGFMSPHKFNSTPTTFHKCFLELLCGFKLLLLCEENFLYTLMFQISLQVSNDRILKIDVEHVGKIQLQYESHQRLLYVWLTDL